MIPLRDENPSARLPIATLSLIGVVTLVFAAELAAGPRLELWLERWALTPARLFALAARSGPFDPAVWLPLVTSSFLHAGWLHFLGNALFLWLFGDAVEGWLGPLRFGLFYLAAGVVAALAHALLHSASTVPTVGASGAIAAVMGAYVVARPRAHLRSLLILPGAVRIVGVRAWIWVALWLGLQLASGSPLLGAEAQADGGVAVWAHAAGFVFGSLVGAALRRGSG
jgi:membrane associated rhomboid family serine protease